MVSGFVGTPEDYGIALIRGNVWCVGVKSDGKQTPICGRVTPSDGWYPVNRQVFEDGMLPLSTITQLCGQCREQIDTIRAKKQQAEMVMVSDRGSTREHVLIRPAQEEDYWLAACGALVPARRTRTVSIHSLPLMCERCREELVK
jgi:hypothetical protein